MGGMLPTEPKVGMGATVRIGSDSYAATITHVTKTRVTVRYDRAVLTKGKHMQSEDQVYLYLEDRKGKTMLFSKRKDGRYHGVAGDSAYTLHVGARLTYKDPSF